MKYDYLIRTSNDSEFSYNLKEAIELAKRYSQSDIIATIERAKIINKQSYYDTNYLRAFRIRLNRFKSLITILKKLVYTSF